jgi:GTP cyclohydrolase I
MTNAIKVLLQIQSGFLQLESTLVVFKDIRAVNMTVCWHHLLFQFSNFEFPNLVIYLNAAN